MLPGLFYLGLLFLLPLCGLILLSFGMPEWNLSNYFRIFDTPVYLKVFRTTLSISVAVTVLVFLLGYPFAYALTNAGPKLRTFLITGVVLPYFTSVLVRTFAWIVLLGRGGIVNETLINLGLISSPMQMLYNRFGVIVGMVHIALPMMVLPLATVMAGIDPRLMRAARATGATPTTAFLTIFLPLSMSGVIAGVLLVFIYCLGFYITPALMGGLSDTMVTMVISAQITDQLNWEFGAALSVVLLVATLLLLWLGSRFFPIDQLLGMRSGTGNAHKVGGASVLDWLTRLASLANAAGRWLPSIGFRLLPVFAACVCILLLAPGAIVAYLSFSSSAYFVFPAPGYSLHNYQAYFSDPIWIRATLTSLRVAVLASLIATCLGASLSLGMIRGNIRGRNALLMIVLSPIIMPTVVVAAGTYFVLVQVDLQGTEFGLALGHAVNALPFVVVVLVSNLKSFDLTLERAALSLGATQSYVFRTVTLPLIRPALLVGAFFAFLSSFDDVVYVLFLGIGRITTLPMRMWEGIKQDISPAISAVATLEMIAAIAIILITSFLTARSQRR